MSDPQHDFVATQYEPRAQAYVASPVHAAGEDLDQLEAHLQGRGLANVLDLGCGGGHVAYRAAPHVGEVIACDLTPAMLEAVAATAAARFLANVTVRQAAAERLPFADASFDAVLSRFSAHHWHDLDAGLREAARVLRPGHDAILIDTVAPDDRLLDTHLQAVELLRDASHVRNHTVAEWAAALARAGLALRSVTTRRLRMDFDTWIARTGTSPLHAGAIRSLQSAAPALVQTYFAIAADGSFDLDTATLVARRP